MFLTFSSLLLNHSCLHVNKRRSAAGTLLTGGVLQTDTLCCFHKSVFSCVHKGQPVINSCIWVTEEESLEAFLHHSTHLVLVQRCLQNLSLQSGSEPFFFSPSWSRSQHLHNDISAAQFKQLSDYQPLLSRINNVFTSHHLGPRNWINCGGSDSEPDRSGTTPSPQTELICCCWRHSVSVSFSEQELHQPVK